MELPGFLKIPGKNRFPPGILTLRKVCVLNYIAIKEVAVVEQRPENKPMQKAKELSQFTAAKTDPMGSWTGQPLDPNDVPVQDADDL